MLLVYTFWAGVIKLEKTNVSFETIHIIFS